VVAKILTAVSVPFFLFFSDDFALRPRCIHEPAA
jgi:hypothetical protein